jgi:hypothetical protein
LELLTSEQLAYGIWEHRVGEETPYVRMMLADGRIIFSEQVNGVLNRLPATPQQVVNLAQGADREYALQELTSFYLSWLQALPGRVINRPEPQGFCGRWRHTSEWALLAQQAGLASPVYRQSIDDDPNSGYRSLAPAGAKLETAVALAGKLFGMTLPSAATEACLRLAELAGTELLGLSLFQAQNGEWNFAGATPYPDFSGCGDELIAHMAHIFSFNGHEGRVQ